MILLYKNSYKMSVAINIENCNPIVSAVSAILPFLPFRRLYFPFKRLKNNLYALLRIHFLVMNPCSCASFLMLLYFYNKIIIMVADYYSSFN